MPSAGRRQVGGSPHIRIPYGVCAIGAARSGDAKAARNNLHR